MNDISLIYLGFLNEQVNETHKKQKNGQQSGATLLALPAILASLFTYFPTLMGPCGGPPSHWVERAPVLVGVDRLAAPWWLQVVDMLVVDMPVVDMPVAALVQRPLVVAGEAVRPSFHDRSCPHMAN